MIDFLVDLWYSLNPQSVIVSGFLGIVVVIVFEFLVKGKKMDYESGDVIKVKKLYEAVKHVLRISLGTTDTSGMEIVVFEDDGTQVGTKINGKSNPSGCNELFWFFKEDIELAPTQTEKTKGNEPMKTEWILFSNEIPTRRDIEVSDDGKSWRVKEVKTDPKTEEKGSETMKTEPTKIKLNWRPITNTEDLTEGKEFIVIDGDSGVYIDTYTEDNDSNPSSNFDTFSDIAFYVPLTELTDILGFPSKDECKKVLEEEEAVSEVKDEVESLLEKLAEADVEKQAKLIALLKKKIPGLA